MALFSHGVGYEMLICIPRLSPPCTLPRPGAACQWVPSASPGALSTKSFKKVAKEPRWCFLEFTFTLISFWMKSKTFLETNDRVLYKLLLSVSSRVCFM